MADKATIITHFEWLVDDDTLDEDQKNTLLNHAYRVLCASEKWNFLYAENTASISGQTVALPSDFLFTHRITLRRGSTRETVHLTPVKFQDRLEFLDDNTKYYIDQKNSVIRFCDDPSSQYSGFSAIHSYQYLPAALSADDDEPVFSEAFHLIIAYEMAKQYYFNDQGEKSRSWNVEMQREYDRLLDGMRKWDGMVESHYDGMGTIPSYAPQIER